MRQAAVMRPVLLMFLASFVCVVYADDLSDANEYFLSGQYQKAITSYERALSGVSDKSEIYYNLGVCHEKLGNLERAMSYYKQAGNVKDASRSAARLELLVRDRKILRLRDDAERAYEAMNYGVAKGKAEEILRLDPANSWAKSLIASLESERAADSAAEPPPETLTGPLSETLVSAPVQDTLAAVGGKAVIPFGFWFGGGILAVALGFLGFFLGRASRRETVQGVIRSLVRLLPAGMLSMRQDSKLGLLFFEKGKVIKALVEEEEGMTIEGSEVAGELAGSGCVYEDKGDGPWQRFADMVIEVYRKAQAEAKEPRSRKRSRK